MQIIAVLFFSLAAYGLADSEDLTVEQGHNVLELIHFEKAGDVYSLSYEAAGGPLASHALPEALFKKLKSEFPLAELRKDSQKDISSRLGGSEACARYLTVKNGKDDDSLVCLDRLEPALSRRVSKWWRECRKMVGI